MTSRADRPFLPTLRRLESELGVPIPVRVRILRELEFDLEELRRQLEDEGLQGEDARARSLDALAPDPGTIQDLGRLHTPRYRRLTGHLAQDRLKFFERSTLAVMTVFVLVAETLVLLEADLLRDPSPFLWLVLGLGALSFAMVTGEAFALWVKGNHRLVRHGLQGVLVTAALTLMAGVFGALVDGYRLLVSLEGEPALLQFQIFQWIEREAALLAASMVLALAGGLAWFILNQWLTTVSGARRDVLGLDLDTETL